MRAIRFPQRRPKETDWHVELAAMSAEKRGHLEVRASGKHRLDARRVKRYLWAFIPAVAFAAYLCLEIFGGKHNAAVTTALAALNLFGLAFQVAETRRTKRERERAAEPTPEQLVDWELRSVAHQLRWFLDRPPDRATYERYLSGARGQLQLVSPEVAARWALPDRGRDPRAETVSGVELEDRRRRLLNLYSEVASADEVAFLASTMPVRQRQPT
jgi:hypothetical protein